MVSLMPHSTYTSILSTMWSTWDLTSKRMGKFILKEASRLDAFSDYPFCT